MTTTVHVMSMIGSVHTADTIQKIIPQDTRSIQHSEQTRNEEHVNASSEQPIAKPEVISCKPEVK